MSRREGVRSEDTMRIIGLAHVGLRVMDFRRTIHFYQQLGFELIREHYEENVVVMRHGCGLELNFIGNANNANEGRNILMDMREKFPGYTHFALRVASVADAVKRVSSLGLTITEGPVPFGDGSTSLFIRDPDGNVIELSEGAPTSDESGSGIGT
ncbi:MAG: glyoxalase/bleomycin resistance protein/dioxygenase [Proteobacteria bacterium]|nr:glyoxalase/bleomycin resistance protein/dioxygenase [Pseudomonadota bacterium]